MEDFWQIRECGSRCRSDGRRLTDTAPLQAVILLSEGTPSEKVTFT